MTSFYVPVSFWTKERDEKLLRLWTEGLTASQIARKLGAASRNAVIGRVNRLRESMRKQGKDETIARRKSSAKGATTRTELKPKPKLPPTRYAPAPAVSRVPPPAKPELLLTLDNLMQHSCRWPFGERPPFLFCGKTSVEGLSYCPEHARISYVNTARGYAPLGKLKSWR